MNVALTRAKSSLFILGNAATLERSDVIWRQIVQDARTRSSIVDVSVYVYNTFYVLTDRSYQGGYLIFYFSKYSRSSEVGIAEAPAACAATGCDALCNPSRSCNTTAIESYHDSGLQILHITYSHTQHPGTKPKPFRYRTFGDQGWQARARYRRTQKSETAFGRQ